MGGDIWTLSDVTVQNHFGTKRSVATLFRFVARFARVRIEDSSRNRFVLNGIQRDFSGGIFVGGILSGYHSILCLHFMFLNLMYDNKYLNLNPNKTSAKTTNNAASFISSKHQHKQSILLYRYLSFPSSRRMENATRIKKPLTRCKVRGLSGLFWNESSCLCFYTYIYMYIYIHIYQLLFRDKSHQIWIVITLFPIDLAQQREFRLLCVNQSNWKV